MPIEIESPEQMGYENLDCNLTESSVSDARLDEIDFDLRNLLLSYGSHTGKTELRELLAFGSNGLKPDDFLVTAGAATALFIIATSLLKPEDALIVAKPNYATNIETPRAIGASIDFLELKFEDEFRVDHDLLLSRITPRTKLVSLTFPHNPTGSSLSRKELDQIIDVIESRNVFLLFDETYRKMAFREILPPAASLSPKVIGVSSLSKTYGLPGIRMGWIACKDPQLMNLFLAAKEQIMICNSVVDEVIAFRFLQQENQRLAVIQKTIHNHFSIVKRWINSEQNLEWVEPSGGVVCFPRIKTDRNIDMERFYKILNEKYRTFVGPGHWFEMDRRYLRIGYGWPPTSELLQGLENISNSLRESRL
jgi:aspartate/methionine/tyrosine aminotransferase